MVTCIFENVTLKSSYKDISGINSIITNFSRYNMILFFTKIPQVVNHLLVISLPR